MIRLKNKGGNLIWYSAPGDCAVPLFRTDSSAAAGGGFPDFLTRIKFADHDLHLCSTCAVFYLCRVPPVQIVRCIDGQIPFARDDGIDSALQSDNWFNRVTASANGSALGQLTTDCAIATQYLYVSRLTRPRSTSREAV